MNIKFCHTDTYPAAAWPRRYSYKTRILWPTHNSAHTDKQADLKWPFCKYEFIGYDMDRVISTLAYHASIRPGCRLHRHQFEDCLTKPYVATVMVRYQYAAPALIDSQYQHWKVRLCIYSYLIATLSDELTLVFFWVIMLPMQLLPRRSVVVRHVSVYSAPSIT